MTEELGGMYEDKIMSRHHGTEQVQVGMERKTPTTSSSLKTQESRKCWSSYCHVRKQGGNSKTLCLEVMLDHDTNQIVIAFRDQTHLQSQASFQARCSQVFVHSYPGWRACDVPSQSRHLENSSREEVSDYRASGLVTYPKSWASDTKQAAQRSLAHLRPQSRERRLQVT